MADKFGLGDAGREYEKGYFYAVASAAVAANGIYMPAYSTSPLFGVAEQPVASGAKGCFATSGTFGFAKPNGFSSSIGQPIYYTPTSNVAGTISATPTDGDLLLGYEVLGSNSALLYVKLDESPKFVAVSSEAEGGT